MLYPIPSTIPINTAKMYELMLAHVKMLNLLALIFQNRKHEQVKYKSLNSLKCCQAPVDL